MATRRNPAIDPTDAEKTTLSSLIQASKALPERYGFENEWQGLRTRQDRPLELLKI